MVENGVQGFKIIPCAPKNGAQWSQNESTILAKVLKTSHKYDTTVILLTLQSVVPARVWWELHQAKHKPFDPDSPHTCCGTWVCRLCFPPWLGVFLSAPSERHGPGPMLSWRALPHAPKLIGNRMGMCKYWCAPVQNHAWCRLLQSHVRVRKLCTDTECRH